MTIAPGHHPRLERLQREARQRLLPPPPPRTVADALLPSVPSVPGGELRVQMTPDDPDALTRLCRLPLMPQLIDLARRRQEVLAFEAQLEARYRQRFPYAEASQIAREVYGDPLYEQMINRLKFADSAQCARMLAARIARDTPGLAVLTATVEGFGGEFVLVAPQLPEDLEDWHQLAPDVALMDPWGQRQGPARGLMTAAGLTTSRIQVQRTFV